MRIFQRPRLSRLRSGFVTCLALAIASLGHPACSSGGEPDKVQAAREQFFEQNVRPLLAANCYSCHSDKKQKGGLRLDSLGVDPQGRRFGPGGRTRQARREPAGRGDQLRWPRDAPDRQAGSGKGRCPHAMGLAGGPVAVPRSRRGARGNRLGVRIHPGRCSPPVRRCGRFNRFDDRSCPRSGRAGPKRGPSGRGTRSTDSSSRACSITG